MFQEIHNFYRKPEENQARYQLEKIQAKDQVAITVTWIYTFTSFFSIITHLVDLTKNKIEETKDNKKKDRFHPEKFLKKVHRNVVEVIVTEKKPFIIRFRAKKHTIKVTGYYHVTNQYGFVCN